VTPLKVCLDARLGGNTGGVDHVVIELARALSRLDGDEEYHFLTYPDRADWLLEHLHGPCRLLPAKAVQTKASLPRRVLARLPAVRKLLHRLPAAVTRKTIRVPRSDGTIEAAGIDVMHFVHQWGFLTDIPSIYHPHDLQHVHLPQFFTPRERQLRDDFWGAYCRQAQLVPTNSSWVKRDVIAHYGLPEDRVRTVELGPGVTNDDAPSEQRISETRARYDLPESFVLYPARSWEHKNHLTLLRGMFQLNERHGLNVPLICTGGDTAYTPQLLGALERLPYRPQVRFLGQIPREDLSCLYRLTSAVCIPSRFEAASFPIWEAFLAGAPVACSTVTSLPDQVGDAGLLFDPDSPIELADCLNRILTDPVLAEQLTTRGKARVSAITWDRAARIFRAFYRHLGKRSLDESDRRLMSLPPIM
jgi:glycosyltransferase involved in cell wall biosynthesis